MCRDGLLTTSDAARLLGISNTTLLNYERQGILKPSFVLQSGHRRYTEEQISQFKKSLLEVKR